MGTAQSSHAGYDNVNRHPSFIKSKDWKAVRSTSVGGRKSSLGSKSGSLAGGLFCDESAPFGLEASFVSHLSDDVHHPDYDLSERCTEHGDHEFDLREVTSNNENGLPFLHYASIEEGEESDEEDDEELDEEDLEERLNILEDARKLKELASFFLHPEVPVPSTFGSRCFFDRPSAPPCLSKEETDEVELILRDAKSLKQTAVQYMHPEIPVQNEDGTTFGRNFFGRASATNQEDYEEMMERFQIQDEAKALRDVARDYLHPEEPVVVTDPFACGRNYFMRPSAVEHEEYDADDEDNDERDRILADMKSLKKLAMDYMHPEMPVRTSDPTVFGRNYFSRFDAPSRDEDNEEEFKTIEEDTKALKKLARDYMHPEHPVIATDPTLFGRNYFYRASAVNPMSNEDALEYERIMKDVMEMKESVANYMHPERPVVTTDPFATGRNYFSRGSAPLNDELDCDEERLRILSDARALKKLAFDFLHPEAPVSTTDLTVFGRNYFSRGSAIEQDSLADSVCRAQVMEDMKAFKKLAADFLHPEKPVAVQDPSVFGRNYFHRPDAPEPESLLMEGVRKQVMEDMKAMKVLAIAFLHPELPVDTSDGTVRGRSYFTRYSAPLEEDDDSVVERQKVLDDMKLLKKLAIDYLHPEIPVANADPTTFGRCYFSRFSAPNPESEDDKERELILAEAAALKKLAVDYLHPEFPVVTSDPTACGRNYFTRASASIVDPERDEIISEMASLKKLAVDYLHPERGVVTSDPFSFGRNYFSRPSAPDDDVDEEERSQILAEAMALKKLAVDYRHPELPVVTSDPTAFGRNYFMRASAPDYDPVRDEILNDMKSLKKLAVDFLHPELGVVTTDPTAFGRNYFSRAAAPFDFDDIDEREQILNETKSLKKLAVDYLHPELGVVTTDPTASGRNYFSRASAPDDGDAEERDQILDEMKLLKKLAVDYLHPELGVVTTDPTASGRNYFDRPSSVTHDGMIHTFPVHEDDHHHDEYSYHHGEHLDHFGMDDEVAMYGGTVYHNFDSAQYYDSMVKVGENEEGGNLSRSPSSVMLFCDDTAP